MKNLYEERMQGLQKRQVIFFRHLLLFLHDINQFVS